MKLPVTLKPKPPQTVAIAGEWIALDALLKLVNAVESGGAAKQQVQQGQVRVNGAVCWQRGKKVRPNDDVLFAGCHYVVVQRTPT